MNLNRCQQAAGRLTPALRAVPCQLVECCIVLVPTSSDKKQLGVGANLGQLDEMNVDGDGQLLRS